MAAWFQGPQMSRVGSSRQIRASLFRGYRFCWTRGCAFFAQALYHTVRLCSQPLSPVLPPSWEPELFEGALGLSVRPVDADLGPLIISYDPLLILPIVFCFSLLWLGECLTSFSGIIVFGLPDLYKAVSHPTTTFTLSFSSFSISDLENAYGCVVPHRPKRIGDYDLWLISEDSVDQNVT